LPSDRDSAARTLDYLNEVDKQEGYALKWHLEKIAGNPDNFRRWEARLVGEWGLLEKVRQGEKQCYRKTERGNKVHETLKEWNDLGPIYKELVKPKLSPSSWYPLEKGKDFGSMSNQVQPAVKIDSSCPKCHKELVGDESFCRNCGTRLGEP
jgi:hypothetical protein